MRKVVGGIFILVSILMLFASYGALRHLWSSYQDSTTSMYVTVGAIEILLAVGCGFTGIRLWRSSH